MLDEKKTTGNAKLWHSKAWRQKFREVKYKLKSKQRKTNKWTHLLWALSIRLWCLSIVYRRHPASTFSDKLIKLLRVSNLFRRFFLEMLFLIWNILSLIIIGIILKYVQNIFDSHTSTTSAENTYAAKGFNSTLIPYSHHGAVFGRSTNKNNNNMWIYTPIEVM